ncbi:MAG: DUF4160 domain-containing protein [Desulfobulbaceae bacterium]|nr:DUF4160 domain-containing protein [Desulfobulbaceae bacterium]
MDDPSSLDSIDDLAEHLHSLLSSGTYIGEFQGFKGKILVEAKELVKRIDGLKIEIYSNEHPPPHFHVLSTDVRATFSLENCRLINGEISKKNKAKIKYWFHNLNAKKSLMEVWNRTRPTDCVVGKYKENKS